MGSLLAGSPVLVSPGPSKGSELAPGTRGDPRWKHKSDDDQRPCIDWLAIEALFIGCLIAAPSIYALAGWFG